MDELVQLYDGQGRPIPGKGGTKDQIYGGILHGSAHVWIYRKVNGQTELLLQKRAKDKQTWPERYDISAAGHVDLGEDPLLTALRETKEEIGLDIKESDLYCIGLHRAYMVSPAKLIDNEFQWVYLLKLEKEFDFKLQVEEVESLEWMTLKQFEQEIKENHITKKYVPHSEPYFGNLINAIKRESGFFS